jgi:predicted permease
VRLDVPLLVAFFGLGLLVQGVDHGRLRRFLWLVSFGGIVPVLVFATFLTQEFDARLVRALAAAVLATWCVGALAFSYAALVARSRAERGTLALGAGFGNTGYIGLPLAQLVFGHAGLALAVVYGRLAWLVPDTAVSTATARLHGDAPRRLRPLPALLLNPPLAAFVIALALRTAGVEFPVEGAQSAAAALVGPVGFLLLGLSLPLDARAGSQGDLARAAGAVAIRLGGGPLALFLAGRAIGADVPGVFYLLAGMPSAFHLLVLARVYELRPTLMRLVVMGSTVPVVVAVLIDSGLR